MKPKFILSKSVVLEKYTEAKSLVDIVSYSSKTNPYVTTILEENTDSMFGVHSIHELKNIEDKSRIMFLCQGWDLAEIDSLIKSRVRFFVVDNPCDLETLKKYLSENIVSGINLFLRLKLKENTLQTEKHFVFGFRSKYINSEIENVLSFPGVENVGIHFHRKTQNMAEWELQREIENVIDEATLEKISYMVIGGGLPSVYANTNTKVFQGIFNKIKSLTKWLNSKDIKVISEPGRFISAPSVKLETNIKAVYENNIIVDVSVYNSDLDALIVPVKLLVENEVEKKSGRFFQQSAVGSQQLEVEIKEEYIECYVIKGITPCSMDLFRYKVYLKEVPKVGDKLVFLNAGAYNFSTDFCDLPVIETKIVD